MTEPVVAPEAPRKYLWPKLLLVAVIIGFVLALYGVSREAQRVQERRQLLQQYGVTNAPTP